jgi:hypothetical protein
LADQDVWYGVECGPANTLPGKNRIVEETFSEFFLTDANTSSYWMSFPTNRTLSKFTVDLGTRYQVRKTQ